MHATRNLLWEAFRDPLNQQFVLVSESDMPLYDPLTFHQQLLSESKSRLTACNHTSRHQWRWSSEMNTPHMNVSHWRKSSQWIGLTRGHVEAVLRDEEVYRSFEQHCWSAWEPRRKAWRDCFSDEHYFPTLLAVLGRENETECEGWGVAAQDWSKGGAHPRAFNASEVTPALVHQMRDPAKCNSSAAYTDAQRVFVDAAVALVPHQEHACQQLHAAAAGAGYSHPMSSACPLTARKLPLETAAAVAQLFNASCGSPARPAPAGTTAARQPNGSNSASKGINSNGAAAAAGLPNLHLLSAQFCQEVAVAGSPPQ